MLRFRFHDFEKGSFLRALLFLLPLVIACLWHIPTSASESSSDTLEEKFDNLARETVCLYSKDPLCSVASKAAKGIKEAGEALDRLEKNAIILFDDYNFINQEGVKKAVEDLKIDLIISVE